MRIAITRLAGKDIDDDLRCRKFGHTCYSVSPLRAEMCPDSISQFVSAVHANHFDALFFASAFPAQLIAPRLSRWPRVIAIGPQTAKTLRHFGIECETLPQYYSRDLVPYLGQWIVGRKIGIPRADVPNPALIEGIRDAGGIPVEVPVYKLIPTNEPLKVDRADALLFTSAMSFKRAVWTHREDIIILAIGTSTAGAMQKFDINPNVVGDGSLEGTLYRLNEYIGCSPDMGD